MDQALADLKQKLDTINYQTLLSLEEKFNDILSKVQEQKALSIEVPCLFPEERPGCSICVLDLMFIAGRFFMSVGTGNNTITDPAMVIVAKIFKQEGFAIPFRVGTVKIAKNEQIWTCSRPIKPEHDSYPEVSNDLLVDLQKATLEYIEKGKFIGKH